MSFLSDIAELAKAGYKPQDVKELMQLNKPQEDFGSKSQPENIITDETPSVSLEITPDKPVETSPKESEQPTDVTDYKALYEAEKEKVSTLQNKLNNADVSQVSQSNEKDLIDAIRTFC